MERLAVENVETSLIQPTYTALKKGYMDATASVRNYMVDKGIHDYNLQGRGARANGARAEAFLLSETSKVRATASLYKPEAKPKKNGDPRIWFSKLHRHVDPNDMLVLAAHDGLIFVINITQVDVEHVLDVQQSGPLWDVLSDISRNANAISDELLAKLRSIASRGLVKSIMPGRSSTAVGRTLEDVLGISMNSSPKPDYKGIELKAFRKKDSKKQLFTKVPNWKISKFSGPTEILNAFGYPRAGREDSLNCTVSASNVNPQGLTFRVDNSAGILHETSIDPKYGEFASWYLADLRKVLSEKHRETFWIHAKSHFISGHEHFELLRAAHTRNPILPQFDVLIEMGDIIMDHQMERKPSGSADEKGPSFKVKPASMSLLFPPSKSYALK